MEHVPYECTVMHEGEDNGCCNYCDYLLVTCVTCTMSEGELTTHCPGEKVGDVMKQMVLMGQADYKDGEWIRPQVVPDLRFK